MVRMLNRKVVPLVLLAMLLTGCGSSSRSETRRTEFFMDTAVTITAYGPAAPEAVQAAFVEMKRVAALVDAEDPNSEISAINRLAGTEPVKISFETFELLRLARQYGALTQGALDITVRPLVELWAIGKKDDYVPAADQIDQALELVNYQDLILDVARQSAFLSREGMGIDLGAIAKGYVADKGRSILGDYGITSALIDAGGNICAMGTRSDGQAWRIGIRHPRPTAQTQLLAVVPGQDFALATAGDYERFFVKDNVRYHHIFDPQTGWPADKLISVTVVGADGTQTDALSTALMVLGPGGADRILGATDARGALMVDEKLDLTIAGDLAQTEFMKERVEADDQG